MENSNIILKGKVWKFDDNIDTDIIIATQYLIEDINTMKMHSFEVENEYFAKEVQPGDIIVAGSNFGCGSSREQAVDVLRALGVSAIIAKSFARIFYRNAINSGLPVIVCEQADSIPKDVCLEVDISEEKISIAYLDKTTEVSSFPEFIMDLIKDARSKNIL